MRKQNLENKEKEIKLAQQQAFTFASLLLIEDLAGFVIFPCTIDHENKTFKVQMHKLGRRNNDLNSLSHAMLIGILEVFLSEVPLLLSLSRKKKIMRTLAKKREKTPSGWMIE